MWSYLDDCIMICAHNFWILCIFLICFFGIPHNKLLQLSRRLFTAACISVLLHPLLKTSWFYKHFLSSCRHFLVQYVTHAKYHHWYIKKNIRGGDHRNFTFNHFYGPKSKMADNSKFKNWKSAMIKVI